MTAVKNDTNTITTQLRDTFNSFLREAKLKEKDAEKILSYFKLVTVEKNEVFCSRGQENSKLGILLSGLLASYCETPQKAEEISRFFFLPEDFVVVDFESFTRQQTAKETIVALEKSEMLVISYAEVRRLYIEFPKMNYIGRELAENAYVKALHRIYDLQVLNAEGRVKKFFKDHPSFYNKVGKKEIASYLRMNRNLVTKYFKP